MSISTFGSVLLASVLACFVTTLGIYVIGKHEKWGNQNVVYVGASHLLPAVEKENRKYSLIAMGAGILIAVMIVVSKS